MKIRIGDILVRAGFNTEYGDVMYWLAMGQWKYSYMHTYADKYHLSQLQNADNHWIWFRLSALQSDLIKCLTQDEFQLKIE